MLINNNYFKWNFMALSSLSTPHTRNYGS